MQRKSATYHSTGRQREQLFDSRGRTEAAARLEREITRWVDDVDAIYAELTQRSAIIDYEMCVQPYGVKEFGVQDLDDHDIGVGEIINP